MKNMVAIIVLLLFSRSLFAQNVPSENLDIYLLIGQSNMAGRAEVSGNDLDTLENVFLYTGIIGEEWENAANPLNKYSTVRKKLSMQKMGPGYHFAKSMKKKNADPIGLVVNAKGGTKIELWMPGTEYYKEAVSRTKAAMKYGNLQGVLWHQGEANSSKPDEYPPKIIALIEALRVDFNKPNLVFVLGQIAEDKPNRENFNRMLLQIPAQIKNVGVATNDGTRTHDGSHFDAKSQMKLGKRYAKEMQQLLSTNRSKR